MSPSGTSEPLRFAPEVAEALRAAGWRLADVPAGLTLESLRRAGAPFKGSKYFTQQAAQTRERPVQAGQVAYRDDLLPASLNRSLAAGDALLAALAATLPSGVTPVVAPAALYVWLIVEHHRQTGTWLIQQRYAWAADESGSTHLAVGTFGSRQPIVVSPIPEGQGRGVGMMPVLIPSPDEAPQPAGAA